MLEDTSTEPFVPASHTPACSSRLKMATLK
jgi:hypothetical protein